MSLGTAAEADALRLVLTLTLARDEAAALLARAVEVDGLWPSAVLAALAERLPADPHLWRDVAATLDRRLAPRLTALAGRPLCDLLPRLSGDDLDVADLAAFLWSQVRRRERALAPVLARAAREIEARIVADAGRASLSDRTCP
jgi:hypothetical protein